MDGYGNFMMQQQQVSLTFYNQNNQQRYQNGNEFISTSEWAGFPLIKSPVNLRRKKVHSRQSNGYEYDESSISRLAKHTHGAPIIMPIRYRNKSLKPVQPFENGEVRSFNSNRFPKAPASDETQSYDESGYHANGTCLPRIIKPRKRRKKDRKPIAVSSMENNPPIPFTFASNQSNGFLQSKIASINSDNTLMNEYFKRPAARNDGNLFFNCDFDPSTFLPLPSSTASSPISLSNSSLSSSTTTSSCSCRLCDPNCKIWAFPLRRSFSDNSSVELDYLNSSNSDGVHIEANKKDVGVIGGNRVKTEWNTRSESSFSILDMIEFNHHQNQQSSLEANRLRSESTSDSGDSGCDLLLGGLNISDNILSSTFKKVADGLPNEGLNATKQHLSEFSLITAQRSSDLAQDVTIGNTNATYLNAKKPAKKRDRMDNLLSYSPNTIEKSLSSCELGSLQRGRDLDTFSVLEMASSGGNCNYGNIISPTLVNKQTFSSSLDFNNNQPGPASGDVLEETLRERNLPFDCFDVTWKGS